jgi:hypothetical protein
LPFSNLAPRRAACPEPPSNCGGGWALAVASVDTAAFRRRSAAPNYSGWPRPWFRLGEQRGVFCRPPRLSNRRERPVGCRRCAPPASRVALHRPSAAENCHAWRGRGSGGGLEPKCRAPLRRRASEAVGTMGWPRRWPAADAYTFSSISTPIRPTICLAI